MTRISVATADPELWFRSMASDRLVPQIPTDKKPMSSIITDYNSENT